MNRQGIARRERIDAAPQKHDEQGSEQGAPQRNRRFATPGAHAPDGAGRHLAVASEVNLTPELRSLERRLLGPSSRAVRRVAARTGGLDAHRILDLTIAVLLLPVLAAVGLVVATVVFIDSPGPILYRARRVGRGGRPFAMWKFRKMTRDAAGPSLTTSGDHRFTPIGNFLSASRLDELPQIWNVLRGDMRLVGPRPEVEEFVDCHRAEYDEILTVTPGLTGPAQLDHVGEGRVLAEVGVDATDYYREQLLPLKIAVDLSYVRTRTVRGDLVILARTLVLPFVLAARRLPRAGSRVLHARVAPMALGLALLVAMFVTQAGPLR